MIYAMGRELMRVADGDDHEIIEGAYDTLDGLVRGSGLYGWR